MKKLIALMCMLCCLTVVAFAQQPKENALPTTEKNTDTQLPPALSKAGAKAEAAANRNDPVALAAALAAYQAEVDASSADAGNELSRLAHLQEVLAKHSAALTVLAERLPEQTSIEHAIEASSKAITKLNAREHPAIPARPQRPTGTGSGGGSANQSGLGQNRGSQ